MAIIFTLRACEEIDVYTDVITNLSLAGGRELEARRKPQLIVSLV